MSNILDEAAALIDSGVLEITLLGQNVNSYGGGGAAFAELLYRINKLGISRTRFMTSHPKDVSDELIACFGELKSLCPHLHLPAQSGSNRVLAAMNRGYTCEQYIETARKLRKTRPDIGLTGDIIVGFPGEEERDFLDTMALVEKVRFDSAFTFIYSPRAGTAAAAMPDCTPREEKSRRIEALINSQQAITREILIAHVGKPETVLAEGVSARDKSAICGKTGRAIMVNFPGSGELTGRLVDVLITSAGKNTLRGSL
jgi:tRNA-2-methylthio-N6-dimethylallyladenosine synthase